jgi:sporulation protein YlmC with PRC-barrel domain
MWGNYPSMMRDPEQSKKTVEEKKTWDLNLRSTHEVTGYHIQAKDGEIGHIEDFIIDDETWAIRYLIIATQNWWPGKRVLLSPKWIHRVSWNDSKAFIDLPRDTIKQSPEYTDGALLSRDYETELHHHYKQQEYWA